MPELITESIADSFINAVKEKYYLTPDNKIIEAMSLEFPSPIDGTKCLYLRGYEIDPSTGQRYREGQEGKGYDRMILAPFHPLLFNVHIFRPVPKEILERIKQARSKLEQKTQEIKRY